MHVLVSFCCLQFKRFADSKEFTKCNSRKIILLHLPSATGMFLKIAQVKTRWTFIHSIDISLRSSVVARSLRKREVPGSNLTVGKNFTFCNSRSNRDPHSSGKPMRLKSTMTYTWVIPCFRKGSLEKYGCRLQWFITFHVSFKEWSVQGCKRAEHKTYSPLDDRWVILTTSPAFHYFRARRDEIRFTFDPPKFVDKITVEDRVSDSLWYSLHIWPFEVCRQDHRRRQGKWFFVIHNPETILHQIWTEVQSMT